MQWQKIPGIKVDELRVDGGPTKNGYLMQFQSDILDIPVQVPDAEELSAMGPAYAAGIAMGIYEQTALFESLNRTRFTPEMVRRQDAQNMQAGKRVLDSY